MITKKKILSLIALAIITVIVSVACSSPTDVENMAVTEAGPTPTPEFPEDNTDNKLTIDTNQGLIQFKDLYFKSGAYYSIYDTVKKIYFYADVRVDENSKPYISVITLDEDGYVIEDEGKFYDNANGKGAVYNLEATRYKSNNRNTATVTFTEDGYLIIKFSNYGADITYSLTGKSYEEIIYEISDGTYIPKIYVGWYVPSFYGTVVETNYINPGAYGYFIDKATYLGNNTWHWGDSDDYQITYQLHRNEKGQRVLKSIEYRWNIASYTNTQIHVDDTNK